MATERLRDTHPAHLTPDHLQSRWAAGWRLAAVEWERGAVEAAEPEYGQEDPPFGTRVAADCLHLEPAPEEQEVLLALMGGVAGDRRLSEVAAELNQKGLRQRSGAAWTQSALFELMPRLIDSGPKITTSREWRQRRPQAIASRQ